MMKFTVISAAVASVISFSAGAAGWGNGYVDYYNHSGRNMEKSEAGVIGVEGGYDTKFVETYGFYEYDVTNKSTFTKGSGHFKVLPKDFTFYAQATDFQDDFGGETTSTYGIGYLGLKGDTWNFKPYLGYTIKGGSYAGQDGVQAGWSAFWAPSAVYLTNWTDVELKEDKSDITVNGGVGAWYDITPSVYTGVQYTYSYNTLGETGYGNSVGFRLGVKF